MDQIEEERSLICMCRYRLISISVL